MTRRRPLLACLLAAVALGATGCAGGGARTAGAPGASTAGMMTPMRFRRMRSMLNDALREGQRGDAARLRQRGPAFSKEGIALIKAVLPHDVARTDVPRYLEGRARFGDALKLWVTAVDSGSDAQVIEALRSLDDATRGWVDAYMGREPETSV